MTVISGDRLDEIRSGLRSNHLGPGPHPDGSPQSVHGGDRAGVKKTSTSTTGAGPAGGYSRREAGAGDYDDFVSGAGERESWTLSQKISASLFDEDSSGYGPGSEAEVLIDSNGRVQAQFTAENSWQDFILELLEIKQSDLDYFTDGGREPYEVHALSVAPRNLTAGGESGWGVTAMHEIIKDAKSRDADYLFLHAAEEADAFYNNIGMYSLEEISRPGYFVMSAYGMENFEEKYNARFSS